ncbi:DsbA family protein [Pseudomonas sp. ABC1]|uniref:DsbA family protein n=1 Tax=Pseudomonas sp. ABC1 TaxID=2748080 RepID=UPI0015C37E15|nr:DsbA family protein [Pseudomonas sp. ABC1]QLF94703.1 DsbA family protein [Pseudomonas sp. ABC1]
MNKTLSYLFDPLCGWCYGAGGPLPEILASTRLELRLLPTGLFSGAGARPMDEQFAAYAWGNDQRIERLTGQAFSERYRDKVLADRSQLFDSGPATVALTAVHLSAAEREFDALKAIQHARYVDGLDITSLQILAHILEGLGLNDAAQRLVVPDAALRQATQERIAQGRDLLARLGASGVPTFLLEENGQTRLLHGSAIFSNPQAFASELQNGH